MVSPSNARTPAVHAAFKGKRSSALLAPPPPSPPPPLPTSSAPPPPPPPLDELEGTGKPGGRQGMLPLNELLKPPSMAQREE